MLNRILSRFFGWMTYEPVVGLLMIIGALVLFLLAYREKNATEPKGFWDWLRRLLESLGVAVMFLGLLWAFRAILNNNTSTFRSAHGRISSVNYYSVKKIWGSPHVQRELEVAHYVERTYKEELPQYDPGKPPLFRTVTRDERVPQNSILASEGEIELTLSRRKKGSAYYSGFTSSFRMDYDLVNDSKEKTEARFTFPLTYGQMLYDKLSILENGRDLSKDLRFSSGSVSWKRPMEPGETLRITASYTSRGVEHFYYQIPEPRQINKFKLTLTVKGLPVSEVNYPEGCLTPTELKPTPDGTGSILCWNLDGAVTTAGMGVALPAPEQPGAKISAVLTNSPYALMLLVVAICLTFLILGKRVNFMELALLSAVYCLLFITMASVSDFFFGFWGSLVLGAVLTLVLTVLLYRREPSRILRVPIFALVAFFTMVYPLSGLLPNFQEAFNGLVVIGLIVYLFGMSLYSRIKIKTA